MAFIKRTKQDVKSKRKLFGKGKRADGKKKVVGVVVTFKDDTEVTLLNPSGKGAKFAQELKDNKHYTNSGQVKVDDKGSPLPLTNEQKAYRSAYLTALSDSAKAYNSKINNKVGS